MTYIPQTWADKPSTSTPVDAARLNYMEAGIAGAYDPSASALTPAVGGDDGPQIQALYDAGAPAVQLKRGQTYTLQTPVFLDASATRGLGGFAIYLNGATLAVTSSLPQIAEWNANPTWTNSVTARAGIFPNTARAALSAGVVTLTGHDVQGGSMMFYVIGPGLVTSNNATAGLVMTQKGGSVTCEGVNSSCLFLLSWGQQCDSNTVRRCEAIATGAPSSSRGQLVWSFLPSSPGDNHTIEDCKADTGRWVATFVNSRGIVVRNQNNGLMRFVDCHGVTIDAAHYEANLSNPTGQGTIISDCSSILFNGSALRSGRTTQYLIEINDTQAEPHRSLLQMHGEMFDSNLSSGDNDVVLPAHIQVTAANANTKIKAMGISATFTNGLDTGSFIPGPTSISSSVSGITTALSRAASLDLLANGTWELRQRGAAGTWELTNPFAPGLSVLTKGVAPSAAISALTGGTLFGSLATSTQYAYAMATKDALGNYGPVSQVGNVTTPASNFKGVVRLTPTLIDAPKTLCIWRQTGSATVITPDHYTEFPISVYSTQLYDTGVNFEGRAWATAGIPALPSDGSQTALMLTDTNGATALFIPNSTRPTSPRLHGALAWTYDPVSSAGVNSFTPTSGTRHFFKVDWPYGQTVTNLVHQMGTIGGTLTSGQNLLGICSSAGLLLASTGDLSATWVGTTGQITAPLSGPTFIPTDPNGFIYVQLLSVGTTTPKFAAASPNSSTVSMNLNLAGGASRAGSGAAAQTTLGGVGGVNGLPTTQNVGQLMILLLT